MLIIKTRGKGKDTTIDVAIIGSHDVILTIAKIALTIIVEATTISPAISQAGIDADQRQVPEINTTRTPK